MIRQALKARKFLYIKEFKGEPTTSNFKLVEEDLPALKDGEVLAEAEYLSVDPYMRPYMSRYTPGCLMIGGQVGRIVESKNSKFPEGSSIFGQFGWASHTIVNPELIQKKSPQDCYVLPDFGKHPKSLGLGALGMPGNTAYFGFLEVCKPKPKNTICVTGAAGAVGTLVGQIAKIKDCRVVGFAGSDDKCKWLENEYGFDKAINYKTENLYKQLKAAAPEGIDCYFDNVGGEISSMIFNQMNLHGRIAVCGAISGYNTGLQKVSSPQPIFVLKQLTMQGLIVWAWNHRWMEGIEQMFKWIDEGKIKYHETVTEGFENIPQAFIDMMNGKNYGKAVVKV